MIVEYVLKGVNPNGKDDHTYEGIFDTTGLSLSIHKDQFNSIWRLCGYCFDYLSKREDDVRDVYAALRYLLTGKVESGYCIIYEIGHFSMVNEK